MLYLGHIKFLQRTLSNILRYIHLRTRNNEYLKIFRDLISRIIGKTIKYKAGDCIIFFCTLYHTSILVNKIKPAHFRQCLTSRYGGYGKHSNTYIDYVTNKRPEMNRYINSKQKENFKFY